MDPQLTRKPFVGCLIDLLGYAIERELLDDAESLLAGIRTLRPVLHELDMLEASIAIQRHAWLDAVRILRALEASRPQFEVGRAYLASCLCMVGDPSWRVLAADIADSGTDPKAVSMCKDLLEPPDPSEPGTSEGATDPHGDPTNTQDLPRFAFAMRA